MFHATARVLRLVLRLLLPPVGRHRAPAECLPTTPSVLPASRPRVPEMRGEDIGLVRPYLVAHERREEADWQRQRRRALVLATMGMDLPEVAR